MNRETSLLLPHSKSQGKTDFSTMLKLLLACACISICVDVGFADDHERSHCMLYRFNSLAWVEGFAIFVAVFVVASVGSWNDYQKEA